MRMLEWIMGILGIPQYLFEGYCIQFFFGRFAEPKLCRRKKAQWAAGIVWIAIRIIGGWLFRETDSVTLVLGLIFTTAVLFVFCVGWYKGNILLKIFLVIQFIALRELAFWTGYSFLYIGNELIDALVREAGNSMALAGRVRLPDRKRRALLHRAGDHRLRTAAHLPQPGTDLI